MAQKPHCDCMGSGWLRENIISKICIPYLPKRLRELDRDDHYHRTIRCPVCNEGGD